MQNRSSSQAVRPRPRWAAVAALGQLQWFLGNVYEAVVDVPQLLVDAHPNREPRLLGPGSPARYYLPAAPVTLVATVAVLIDSWRRPARDRHGLGKHGICGSADRLPRKNRQSPSVAQR